MSILLVALFWVAVVVAVALVVLAMALVSRFRTEPASFGLSVVDAAMLPRHRAPRGWRP